MKYVVVEYQWNNGTLAVLKEVKDTKELAEQEYHTRLSYAAVSALEAHTVCIYSALGVEIARTCYKHGQEEA